MKKRSHGSLFFFLILAVLIIMSITMTSGNTENKRIEYPQLLEMIEKGEVDRVAIRSTTLVGRKTSSKYAASDFPTKYDFETTIGSDFIETVTKMVAAQKGVDPDTVSVNDFPFELEYMAPAQTSWFLELLPYLLSLCVSGVFIWLIFRQQGGGGKVMNFGKSHANQVDPSKNKITFKDVAGADEEKEELKEIVDFLKTPKIYTDLGARIPKGVLLVGPPGTGKTLLAKAVAGEAGVPFFSISGSDFVEMFVGVGASRVRDLFDQAKRAQPAIIFIDEIDAVGRHRGSGLGGGHDEREQTLNQLLVEMDGFSSKEGVIVMAATNRRDILDPALLRPGRFDRQIAVNYPDLKGREAILKVHSRGKPLAANVDLENIAKRVPFTAGADLENIMNEAAIMAARERKSKIDQDMLVRAVERVQMGPEKKSHQVLEEEKRMTACHEAGHAIVGHYLPRCDDVHLITIVPRGNGAAGFTLSLPEKELDFSTRKELIEKIAMALGGHAAEKLVLDDNTNGATSDLQHATKMARAMVTKFGMSDELGTIYLDSDHEVIVGMEFGQTRAYSEETAARIDAEVSRILRQCYEMAQKIITEHRDELDKVSNALCEKETLSRADFIELVTGVRPEEKLFDHPDEKLEEQPGQDDQDDQTSQASQASNGESDDDPFSENE